MTKKQYKQILIFASILSVFGFVLLVKYADWRIATGIFLVQWANNLSNLKAEK